MRNVRIKWVDSYGALTGWQEVEGFKPDLLEVISTGTVIYEDEKVVSIAQNYAVETAYTPEQANGIMTIPKACIIETKEIKTE